MGATEDFQKEQEIIPIAANFGLNQIAGLCQILEQRKRYAKYFLENPGTDKTATLSAIKECNNLISKFMGL